MAKRRSGATTRAQASDRSRGGRGKGAGASKRAMSSRGTLAIAPREVIGGRGGRGSQARGGGMMSGARDVAAKVGKTTKNAAETTLGAAREWAAGAADAAGNVASKAGKMGTQVAGKVRENPWPTILIGAGATWLAVDAIRGRSEDRSESTGRGRRSSSSSTSGGTLSNTGRVVGQAMDKVASAGRAAGGQIEDFVRERPLLAGAATLGLGMAVGMAIPSSTTENELLGGARDKIVGRARSVARDTMQKVRDVAESVERIGPFGGSSNSGSEGSSRATGSRGGSRGRGGSRS